MTSPGTVITKQHIIDRFNTIVRAGLSPAANGAAWAYGSVPSKGNNYPGVYQSPILGPRNEPAATVSELPAANPGDIVYNTESYIWTALNNIAKRFAKVRLARWNYYITGANPYLRDSDGPQTAHVSDGYSLQAYVGVSSPMPANGKTITVSDLDNFLVALRNQLNTLRNGNVVTIDVVACHVSCHSACHGSRGRR